MEKTKLGISVGLMAAITFFSGLFIRGELSILLILLAGYCLLAEENVWLKKCAVKAVALMVIFAVVTTVVGLIPEAFNFIDGIFMIFNGRFSVPIIEGRNSAYRSRMDRNRAVPHPRHHRPEAEHRPYPGYRRSDRQVYRLIRDQLSSGSESRQKINWRKP